VVIVADHTKFGRLALARLCGLEEVQRFISDGALNEEFRDVLEAAGATVHLASADDKTEPEIGEPRTNGSGNRP
jgi:DeoR/GlpR family transcriptional regulator of sugar metabolism